MTSRDLASLIGRVINAPTADLHGDGAIVRAEHDDDAGLSGPMTRMSIAKAEAEAKAARAEFIAGEGIPEGVTAFEGSSGTISVTEDDVMPEPLDASVGAARGRRLQGARRCCASSIGSRRRRRPACSSLEGRAGVLKEAYITDGQPQFVNSNVESERLGNFLLEQKALTPQALQRAVSVMHHFGGRLADTLVGLDLLDPLEAYRLLAKQVAAKLMEAFCWQKGRYTWTPRAPNPYKSRALHLDRVPRDRRGRGADRASRSSTSGSPTNTRAFVDRASRCRTASSRSSGSARRCCASTSLLDGRTRLGDLAARVRSPEARLNLLRLDVPARPDRPRAPDLGALERRLLRERSMLDEQRLRSAS